MILGYFSDSSIDRPKLYDQLIELIKNPELNTEAKVEACRCFGAHKFQFGNGMYQLLLILEGNSNKRINESLLLMLNQLEDIDPYVDYLNSEFLRAYGIESRDDSDETHRRNERLCQELILKLKSPVNFLKFIKHYFDDPYRSYGMDFETNISERCMHFIDESIDFLKKILDQADFSKIHAIDKFLKPILIEPGNTVYAIEYILSEYALGKTGYLIAQITNAESLNGIIEHVKDQKPDIDSVENLRNYLSNWGKRDLAKIYNDELLQAGFEFRNQFITDQEREIWADKNRIYTQSNFDALFNPDALLTEVKKFFDEHGEEIELDALHKLERSWYDENGHGNVLPNYLSIIRDASGLSRPEISTYTDVQKIIFNDDFLFNRIKIYLDRAPYASDEFSISESQISKIDEWCCSATESIDFSKIIQADKNSYYYKRDYEKLETALFFWDRFELGFPIDFLLNCIPYYGILISSHIDDGLNRIRDAVNDDVKFDSKVYELLNQSNLFKDSQERLIDYVLESRNEICFKFVKSFILTEDYCRIEVIRSYIELSEDTEILVDACRNINSATCWNSISVSMEKGLNRSFCMSKAIDYFKQAQLQKKRYGIRWEIKNWVRKNGIKAIDLEENHIWVSNALVVIIQLGQPRALRYILNTLQSKYAVFQISVNLSSLKKVENYMDIIWLYFICENTRGDLLEDRFARSVLEELIINNSVTKTGFRKIQIVLIIIKLTSFLLKKDKFYANFYLNKSKKVFLGTLSKPYKFKEALKKTNSIMSN